MKKRILIVEDDDGIASIERDYLEVGGYEVKVEENGTAGLTEALTGEYDLILLDIMLPGMDGFQIVRKLRDKIDIPIMMVTARRSDIDKIRGLGFGADDYIEKPFSPGVLVARVKSQLVSVKFSSVIHLTVDNYYL
uniref:response regulator transcription factor n=1 Tax=uncultured Dialister sp. TaxID=278064 RepID=UPI00266E99D0